MHADAGEITLLVNVPYGGQDVLVCILCGAFVLSARVPVVAVRIKHEIAADTH